MNEITRKVSLYFPQSQTENPVVYHLVKDYDLMVNIFRAKVTADEEGYLVLDLTGEQDKVENAIAYIESLDVEVRTSNKGVAWNESRCTGCGNCLPHCPTGALAFKDRTSMEMSFDEGKCVECLSCISNCPFGACTSLF